MADNNLSGSMEENVKEEADKTDSHVSLLLSFDDEIDAGIGFAESGLVPIVNVSNYNFSKPIKRFDTDVSYDSAQVFYQDLGFNDITIGRLKPYFSTLKNFIHYDVFAIIEQFEVDILANEDTANKLSIKSQQDFYQVLRLFGFQDEWAQTYTWAMGKAYADQLVKHSIEECIRLRLSPSNTILPFPDWTSNLGNNQWQTLNNSALGEDQNIFVRNHTRRNQPGSGQNLNDIDFNNLVKLTRADHVNPQYWFHATDWNSVENILRYGADRRGEHSDFSKGPTYYLNNDYRDCYEFLSQRNHKFKGKHAILIYEFDPEQLSNGRYVHVDSSSHDYLRIWQQIVFSCININQKEIGELNRCDYVFGWQCANPNDVRPRLADRNTPTRRTRSYDTQYAVQLAIRTNRMLEKVDDHLIGVVIFEHS